MLNLTNTSGSPATVSLDLFGAEGPDPGPGQPRTPRGAGHHPLRHPGRARPGTGAAQRPGPQRRRAGGRRHPAERAAGAHPRRRRLHRPGHGPGPPPGDFRRRHPGSGRAGGRSRRSPASGTPDRPCRSPCPGPPTPSSRSSCTGGTARRLCPAAAWSRRRPEPSPRSRSPECRPGPTPWPSVPTSPSPPRPGHQGTAMPRTPRTSPGPPPRRDWEASTSFRCPRTGDRYLVFGAPEGRATISYTPITADGKIRAAATADIAGGTTASIKVPADVGRLTARRLRRVRRRRSRLRGAVLLQQDGRQDISTVAIAPGAAGQEQVPVTLGY